MYLYDIVAYLGGALPPKFSLGIGNVSVTTAFDVHSVNIPWWMVRKARKKIVKIYTLGINTYVTGGGGPPLDPTTVFAYFTTIVSNVLTGVKCNCPPPGYTFLMKKNWKNAN